MTDTTAATDTVSTPAAAATDTAPAPSLGTVLYAAPEGESSTPGADTSTDSTEGGGNDTLASDTSSASNDSVSGDTPNDSVSGDDTTAADSTSAAPDYSTLTLPEGFTPDDALMGQFKEEAAKANLDPKVAQNMLGLAANLMQKQSENQLAAFQDQQRTWQAEVLATPEFTGDANRSRSTALLGRVLDEYGTPEVRQQFDATGLGNHPAVVKMMLKMAEALTEGEPTRTPSGPAAKLGGKSLGAVLYGNPTPRQ